MTSPRGTRAPRSLGYVGFAVVVLVYLAIIQGVGLLIGQLTDTDLTTTRGVVLGLWIPLGLALAFTYGVVAWLGWWRPVLRDDRPVQRWVYVVPVLLLLVVVVAVDYAALADKGILFTLTLLVATQLVGWGEEGMFRGIGVTTLREHGLTEGKVALWSSIIFGAVHLSNALGRGAQAIPQAIAVSLAGYFFYLVRRVSRGNALNSVIHGLFDFSILTGTAILVDQEAYPGALGPILVYPVLAIVLIVRRRHIEPTHTDSSAVAPR